MVAVAMPKGLKVSIKFTPQAHDDYLYLDEDSGGEGYDYGTDDLLANDDAANAARVWGIFAQSETDVQNNIGTLVSNTAPNGDSSFTVGGADGVAVEYDAETGDIVFTFDPADFDYLAEGESVDVGAFTYVIRMSNGAFSTAIAHIVVNGTNDAPVITVEDGDSDSKEVDETDSGLTTFGTLTVTDVDASDEVSSSVTGVKLSGDFGALTEADVLAMLTLEPLTPLPADGELNNLKWLFDSGSEAFNFLAVDESLTLTYTITSDDGNGGTDTHDVAIVINGTNDAPVISVGAGDDDDAEIDETDAGLTASGFLTVTDLDVSDEVASTVFDVVLGGNFGSLVKADVVGMLTLDPLTPLDADPDDLNNLKWNFDSGSQAFDFLAVDESLTLTYTVKSSDGNGGNDTHEVTITVNGTNDDPVITVGGGDSDGDEIEETDAGLTTSGTLTVNDVDTSDEVSSSVSGVVLDGVTGGLTEADVLDFLKVNPSAGLAADVGDANNLTWSFDSGSEAFDFLEDDEFLTLTYTITSEDGNGGSDTQTVTIKINGTAEAPANQAPVPNPDAWVLSDATVVAAGVITAAWFTHNDTDADGDPLYVTAVTGLPVGLTANYNLAGHLIDITGTTPASGFSLGYTLSDGTVSVATGSVSVTVLDTTNSGTDDFTLNGNDFSYIDAQSGADKIAGDAVLVGNAGIDTFVGAAGNDTLSGAAGNDTLLGVGNDDSLNGGDGDDYLDGGNNVDSVNGDAGNDILVWDKNDTLLDGGTGTDTLRVSGNLDLTAVADATISNIDRIDITNYGADATDETLTLNATDVLDHLESDGATLFVLGDAGDTVDLAGAAWTAGVSGIAGFNLWTNAGASVYVDTDITNVIP